MVFGAFIKKLPKFVIFGENKQKIQENSEKLVFFDCFKNVVSVVSCESG